MTVRHLYGGTPLAPLLAMVVWCLSGASAGAASGPADAAGLDVVSPADCVTIGDVAAAIDAAGGIDPAERVRVSVQAAPMVALGGERPADPLQIVVEMELARAPPLRRVVPIRPIECKDVPDLVAVLLLSQRRSYPPTVPAAAAAVTPAAGPSPSTSEPPASATPPIQADGPCEGGLLCGPWGITATLGTGVTLPRGARAQLGLGYTVTDALAVVGDVDVTLDDSVAGYAGIEYRARLDRAELAVRALGGGGADRVDAVSADGVTRCEPAATAKTASSGAHQAGFVAPLLAVRGRLGWVFAEAGMFWHLGTDAGPTAYATLGVQLLGH